MEECSCDDLAGIWKYEGLHILELANDFYFTLVLRATAIAYPSSKVILKAIVAQTHTEIDTEGAGDTS